MPFDQPFGPIDTLRDHYCRQPLSPFHQSSSFARRTLSHCFFDRVKSSTVRPRFSFLAAFSDNSARRLDHARLALESSIAGWHSSMASQRVARLAFAAAAAISLLPLFDARSRIGGSRAKKPNGEGMR